MNRYDPGLYDSYDPSVNSAPLSQINMSDSGTDMIEPPPDRGERFDQARRSALKVYLVLLVVGFSIGGLSLLGIFLLMQHFGLTDVPVQLDQG